MEPNFFFYDLETSGLKPREDRIMQFAGQRTDMNLEPIGEPVNILVRMTDEVLPSPGAIMVTHITPQMTLQDGISEPEFCKYVLDNVFAPNTIAVGYNTVRFDDEFMRAILWRNFQDPYEFEWKDGRSRWDILDVVRLVRAIRPEGIEWPFTEEGRATNRLELITKLNGISHEHAHDALSDVYATIAVARLIREKQPKMFEYLLKMRDKKEIKRLVNLENKQPFVHASGRYSGEYNKTTVAVPIAPARNGNVLVFDLRYSLGEIQNGIFSTRGLEPVCLRQFASQGASVTGLDRSMRSPLVAHGLEKTIPESRSKSMFPIVKQLCCNKCPAVAPISVLDVNDGWGKIGLTKEEVLRNYREVMGAHEFAEKMREEYEKQPEFPKAEEPEAAIYDGFLNDTDRNKCGVVRGASANQLADLHPEFSDERLPELLLHYKGRNFPQSMTEDEMEKWENYRKMRLEKQAPQFLKELELNAGKDKFIADELRLYFESLM